MIPALLGDPADVIGRLERAGVRYLTWSGWELLDAYERGLGEAEGRDRIKVVPREEMVAISLGQLP
jgi:ferredoxin--NADP+ reductase